MWDIDTLDLGGYLNRLGVPTREPSRAALDELHEAHVRAFTFDNIDVLLRQHPGVDLDAVQRKFIRRGRGGYCFEHATIFAAALERLGYSVQRHLGRVGDPASTARTHAVVWVDVAGERLLADPGFGLSLVRPIPLRDGAEDDYLGWRYGLRQVDQLWQLQRFRNDGWQPMHTHDELPVFIVDIVSGHHFTSTFPDSHFRHTLIVTKYLPGRHVSLTHEAVTIRAEGAATEHRPLRAGELAEWLDVLQVPLTGEERARLIALAASGDLRPRET